MDLRTLVRGLVGGLFVVVPLLYFGVLDHPGTHGSSPEFVTEWTAPSTVFEEPFRVRVTTNSGIDRRALYDPQTRRYLSHNEDPGSAVVSSTLYGTPNVTCWKRQFQDNASYANTVQSFSPRANQQTTFLVDNESKSIIRIDTAPDPQRPTIAGPFATEITDLLRWERTGTATYHGQSLQEFTPRSGWSESNSGRQYWTVESGRVLYDAETGVVHLANFTARKQAAANRLEKLTTNGTTVRFSYRVDQDVQASEITRPAFCLKLRK
jgi:hypothetical protein